MSDGNFLNSNSSADNATAPSLTLKEKVGYGLGDTASNLVFQVMINYMLIFYTDVFGITAAAAGTLMLVVRIFDAVTDPIMGGIADRTNTRWGRYRPYLILTSIPYAIIAVIAFITPDLSATNKLIYAYITYALLTLAYTAVNIPYSALGGVITTDNKERASVQSIRFALAMVGGVLVTAFMMEMVDWFGGENEAMGFTLAMAVYAALALVCFLVCFLSTRERVTPPVSEKKTSLLQDLQHLVKNDQFMIVAIIALVMLVLVAMRGAVAPYYVEYYLEREELISEFMTTGMLAAFVGALFTNVASAKMSKLALFKGAALISVAAHALLFFIPADQVALAFIVFALANFFHMVLVPIMFSMVPDTADYGQMKYGKNCMGMAFSAHLLAIKLGLALGAAGTGWILGAYGYVANQVQTESALTGILLCFAAIPAVIGVMLWGLMNFYKLDSQAMDEIHAQTQQGADPAEPSVAVASA